MTGNQTLQQNIIACPDVRNVKQLLGQNDLPIDDIDELDMQHFFGCVSSESLIGVVGIECFGTDGLVRSLSVSASAQGQGLATALLGHLENHAASIGVTHLFLLTETADQFFVRNGYETTPRESAPSSIQQSSQFSSLCPASAAFMSKALPQ